MPMRQGLSNLMGYTLPMPAAHHSRIQRLHRLEALLPKPGTRQAQCLDGARLLQILGQAYGEGPLRCPHGGEPCSAT